MKENQKIILVGLMGAGKSTLGRQLARRLNIPFYDSDSEIERQTGATIAWIFDIEGEEGFRRRETETLEKILSDDKPMVLATGGGIVTQQRNRELLNNSGALVIYLDVPLKVLRNRIASSKTRPLLNNSNAEEVLKKQHAVRHPMYMEVAGMVYHVRKNKISNSVDSLHKEIMNLQKID